MEQKKYNEELYFYIVFTDGTKEIYPVSSVLFLEEADLSNYLNQDFDDENLPKHIVSVKNIKYVTVTKNY